MDHKKTFKLIAIVLAAAVLLAAGVIIVAEYTRNTYEKRVVATRGSEVMFSSNYLRTVGSPLQNARTFYVSSVSSTPSGNVTVCNYAQTEPGAGNPRDIVYNFTATLVKRFVDSNGDVSVAEAGADDVAEGLTFTVSCGTTTITLNKTNRTQTISSIATLTAGEPKEDAYSVTLPSVNANSDILLRLTAVSTSGLDSAVTLDGLFTGGVMGSESAHAWEGRFNETGVESNNPTPAAYDGFNYVITGSGSGWFTLLWNSSKLAINDYFTDEELTSVTVADASRPEGGAAGDWKSVTFQVNSDAKSRYLLQFYRTSDTGYDAWADLKTYVSYIYPAPEPAGP